MQYILLDTCIWLDFLAPKPESRSLLKSILSGLNQNKLKILLSNVTVEEYSRHQDTIVGKYTDSLKSHLKNAKKIQDYKAIIALALVEIVYSYEPTANIRTK